MQVDKLIFTSLKLTEDIADRSSKQASHIILSCTRCLSYYAI